MTDPVYLDYAATTPVDPRVAALMWRYLTPDGVFGNPGSRSHGFGQAAAEAVEQARARVAALIKADPREIVWTSGATESDNLALKGAARANARKGRHIVTCKSEHKAVLDVCHSLQQEGFRISYLDPRPDGLLDPDEVADALTDDTVLVSVMHVNNEIGVIQDIAAIGALTRARGILLHVDAAQSAGKTPIDVEAMNIDLLSVCAHKVYGPKGIGALYVRRRPRVRLEPLLHGGGQERGLRAGTLATHQIVGMGEAFRIAGEEMDAESRRLRALRERLLASLSELPAVILNGHPERCVPGILNLGFAGLDAEALLLGLDELALSSGSACSSATQEVSHVLRAIGLDTLTAAGSIRISLGRFTTEAEVDHTAARIRGEVERLRELSPVWDDPRAVSA